MEGDSGRGTRPLIATMAALALGACGAGPGVTVSAGETGQDRGALQAQVRAEFFTSEYGVRVGIRIGYPVPHEVTDARLKAGEQSVEASLYPLDGKDYDEEPASVRLAQGDQVLVEATLLPPCTGPAETPVFEVDTRSEGVSRVDRYTPADAAGYERAVAQWCDRPVTMMLSGWSASPEGDYELRMSFSNPGPDPVDVISEQVDDGSSTWARATVTVPAGVITEMTIEGHGPPECAAVPPWESGHVLVDGEEIRPRDHDRWSC